MVPRKWGRIYHNKNLGDWVAKVVKRGTYQKGSGGAGKIYYWGGGLRDSTVKKGYFAPTEAERGGKKKGGKNVWIQAHEKPRGES